MVTPERWWILDPAGHRRHDMENTPDEMEFGGQMVPVIKSDPGDSWVCDWCNAEIPLVNRQGRAVPVPMERSRAVCPECMARTLRKAGLPVTPGSWGPFHCGCPPCVAFAQVLEAHGSESWN